MSQLRQQQSKLEQHDIRVCVVTFDAGPLAQAYVTQTKLEWPLLVDQDRQLYRAYGMERGTAWNIYGPRAVWTYFKLFARGRWLKRPGSDFHQLGGDVLIDPTGTVRFHYVGVGPHDRPAVATLLDVVTESSRVIETKR